MKVVLIEPEIPFNTGSIGRTCVAVDLELILVGKLGFSLDSSAVARSGTRYWKSVKLALYNDWAEFVQRRKPLDDQMYFFEEDDSFLEEINQGYRSGKILAGEMKQLCIDRASEWLSELSEKRDETAHLIERFFD